MNMFKTSFETEQNYPFNYKGSNGSWIYQILTNLSKMIFWVILIKNMV